MLSSPLHSSLWYSRQALRWHSSEQYLVNLQFSHCLRPLSADASGLTRHQSHFDKIQSDALFIMMTQSTVVS